jgi:hypothetical protein
MSLFPELPRLGFWTLLPVPLFAALSRQPRPREVETRLRAYP